MSLTQLSIDYANRYVNAPAARTRAIAQGQQPSITSGQSNLLATLATYIPSDILTLYLAGVAAIQNWDFTKALAANATSIGTDQIQKLAANTQHGYLFWLFIVTLIASPIWAVLGVYLASKANADWKPYLFPTIAAPIAFAAYAFAVPNSWLSVSAGNSALFASLAVLAVTPILHILALLLARALPAP